MTLSALASYLFALGDRVAQERMILPPVEYAGNKDPIQYPLSKPTPDKPQGWSNWEAAGLQEGKEIYVTYCLVCHGCAGNGLGSYGGTMVVTPANLNGISAACRMINGSGMCLKVSQVHLCLPGKPVLPSQRWKMIRCIQQIFSRLMMRDPDEGYPTGAYANLTNPLPLNVEVIEEGKSIFIRECMVCHGDAGRGNGPYREWVATFSARFW